MKQVIILVVTVTGSAILNIYYFTTGIFPIFTELHFTQKARYAERDVAKLQKRSVLRPDQPPPGIQRPAVESSKTVTCFCSADSLTKILVDCSTSFTKHSLKWTPTVENL